MDTLLDFWVTLIDMVEASRLNLTEVQEGYEMLLLYGCFLVVVVFLFFESHCSFLKHTSSRIQINTLAPISYAILHVTSFLICKMWIV